jgi:DNA-binding CsgD family transcriptional regulator
VAALSGREREVAEMVADGRTNAQIAAALQIAQRTVETHLASACRKLGVRGRAAIGRALSE